MKVVFDTNVLISAFITEGYCTSLLHYTAKHHDLVASFALLEEFKEKLALKFDFTPATIERALFALRPILQIVEPLVLHEQISRDSDDDLVLATALSGNCAYIVTGDKDLLDLNEFRGIQILKPRQFGDTIGLS